MLSGSSLGRHLESGVDPGNEVGSGRDTATAYANYCGSVGFTALYHNESAKDVCLRIAFFFEMNFSHQSASDHVGRESYIGPLII